MPANKELIFYLCTLSYDPMNKMIILKFVLMTNITRSAETNINAKIEHTRH